MLFKLLIISDTITVFILIFINWLYPRIDLQAKRKFEDLWLVIASGEPGSLGRHTTRRIVDHIQNLLKRPRGGFKIILSITSASLAIFATVYFSFSVYLEHPSLLGSDGIYEFGKGIFSSISHTILPLFIASLLFDIVSAALTFILLITASGAKNTSDYLRILILDFVIACFFILSGFWVFYMIYYGSVAQYVFSLVIAPILLLPVYSLIITIVAIVVHELRGSSVIIDSGRRDGPYVRSKQENESCVIIAVVSALIVSCFTYAVVVIFPLAFANRDSQIGIIFLLSVSCSVVIPTIIHFAVLLFVFLIHLLTKFSHRLVKDIIFRIATERRSVLAILAVFLLALKDILYVLFQ